MRLSLRLFEFGDENTFIQVVCLGFRWLDDLQLYVLSNSISVISGRWEGGNERVTIALI